MIRNLLITSLRNIYRNKAFSAINLAGLVISMSVSLLIILIIQDQYSFDKFHEDADRIYRINTEAIRKNGSTEKYASSPLPLGHVLENDYSFTEKIIRINRSLSGEVISPIEGVNIDGIFTEPSFFEVFNFNLETSHRDPLSAPYNIILTQTAAEKIFGDSDPMGNVLSIDGLGDFTVTGILLSSQGNTHFNFEALASISTLPQLEIQEAIFPATDNWKNYYSNYTYIKLKEGVNPEELENALEKISTDQYATLELETRDSGYRFYLQSLNEITPGPVLSNQMGTGMPKLLLYFLTALVVIVMMMACLNYTQLTVAKSLSRVREIGVRKVIGAYRKHVFLQFLTEAIVFSLVAMVLSYFILQLLKPAFLSLHLSDEFSISLQEGFLTYLLFIGFSFFAGIIAGLLPASYLSTFKPIEVLKSGQKLKISSKLTLRRILIVIQFTISLIFIITVIVIYQQTQYMLTADYGFNAKDNINIRLQGVDYENFSSQISGISGVDGVAGISHSLGTWEDRSSDYKVSKGSEPFEMRDFLITEGYLENIGVELAAGSYFDESMRKTGGERFVIINKKAVKHLKLGSPLEALGKTFYVNDTVMLEVIGVTEDFHFRPFNYDIGPVAFRLHPDKVSLTNIKLDPMANEHQTIAQIEKVWEKLDPVHPLEWENMNDELRDAYETSGLTDISKLVGFIAFLAISISCLGLLGMVMYMVQTRLKEIGMRKVLGASSLNIALLLSKNSLVMLSIAMIISLPVSYKICELLLGFYAYKIPLSIGLFIGGTSLVTVLVIITVGSQTLKAALANPVKWLRYE